MANLIYRFSNWEAISLLETISVGVATAIILFSGQSSSAPDKTNAADTSSVFKFHIANSGATAITNYSPSLRNFADKKAKVASYMEGCTYKNYYGDAVTMTIISIDANRVSGTFSGTFKADANDGGATLNITDGSFNLPFEKN